MSVAGSEGTLILVVCRVCGWEEGDSWERGLPSATGSNVEVRVIRLSVVIVSKKGVREDSVEGLVEIPKPTE